MARKRQRNVARDYPRTARLNELLREVIANEFERIDDDRWGLVTVTGVEVDNELTLARVYVSSFDTDIDVVLEVLEEQRGAIRKAVGSGARLRRVPNLAFSGDPAVETGSRVEEILRSLESGPTNT